MKASKVKRAEIAGTVAHSKSLFIVFLVHAMQQEYSKRRDGPSSHGAEMYI